MRTVSRRLWSTPSLFVLAVLLAGGCTPSKQDDDDTGSSSSSGGNMDAGTTPAPDAGADAGATIADAGTAHPDAGSRDATIAPHATCGNGRLDSQEVCEGNLFQESISSCDDNYLGNGQTHCRANCTLDVSGCDVTDYCQGNGFYLDDECDACEWVGGHADPACAAHCGADGFCASWYDSSVGQFSCEAAGLGADPDCGTCGNGVAEGHEFCDGTSWREVMGVIPNTCEQWSYPGGGTLRCFPDCTADFSECQP